MRQADNRVGKEFSSTLPVLIFEGATRFASAYSSTMSPWVPNTRHVRLGSLADMFEAACGTVECALRPRKPDELGHDLIEIAAAEPVVTHGGTKMRDYWHDF